MCLSSKTPSYETTPTPPEPETVKRLDSEVAATRSQAKQTTAQRYGVGRTNVTGGAALLSDDNTKKKKLGGD